MKELALITAKDLSLVQDNALNEKQLKIILRATPKEYVRTRPAKGGGEWEYVSGGYVKKLLNLVFGWDWSFQIINQMVLDGEAIVQGRLTVNTNGKTIIKEQFGNKDIIYRKGSEKALSIGNDLKAAATDCLKKCAAELGLAADIYNKEEFREIQVVNESDIEIILNEIKTLYADKFDLLTKEQVTDIERILENNEVRSYKKIHKLLSEL